MKCGYMIVLLLLTGSTYLKAQKNSVFNNQVTTKQAASTKQPTESVQRIEQTVKWILEKLNTYSGNYILVHNGRVLITERDYNLSYNPNDKQIIVNYTSSMHTDAGSSNTQELVKIPIQLINKIEYKREKVDPDVPNPTYNEYITIFTYGKDIIADRGNRISIKIPISISQENNLLERLQKAFNDLKSNFPKRVEAY